MKQIGIKLPVEDVNFLKWYSEKNSTPVASLYRQATADAFKQWKIRVLLKEYQSGAISFKEFCNLANLSLLEGMLIIEEEKIEPPIPEIIDDYTIEMTQKNIKQVDLSIFKNKKKIVRTAPKYPE